MALSERSFGPVLGGPAVYLDTSRSEVVDATDGSSLFISGEDFILGASYERLGPDLLLSGDDHSVFIKGYFTHEDAPDLYTSDGSAVVRGSTATRLAGPANSDALLIFYDLESSKPGAAIIRYQEGGTQDDDFNGELSIVGIFSNVTDFEDVNVI